MKAMKKVLAFVLALAMVVTAAPVTNAAAKTANLSAGKTVNKTYYTGKTHTLKLTGVTKADVKSTTWKSSNAKVVKIVADSQTKVSAQFKCVKKGTATVTATVALKNGNTKTYKAKITVKAPTLTVSPDKVTLSVGDVYPITAKKTPSGAKLTYSSSDPGVASISGKKITAHSAGHAIITVQLTNGTKKISKNVDVTVEALQDALTAQLMTPITGDYPNTVMVNQDALISVKYVKNGKPVAGETLVVSESVYEEKPVGYSHSFANRAVQTDSNGIATFVLGVDQVGVKADTKNATATVRYTIQVPSTSESVTGKVSFAAIGFNSVVNTNANDTKLVPGRNYVASNGRDGVATTTNMREATDEYVASQQVSKEGGNEHAVTFDGGYPWIYIPGTAADVSNASKGVQTVNQSSGKYGTYDWKNVTFALDEDPRKLTYATVNIEDLKLSKYTKFTVAWFNGDPANGGTQKGSREINGPHAQSNFGVQIPITDDISKLYIRVTINSAGQVDTAMNDGFKVSTVDYVYRTITNGVGGKTYPLKDATITWSQVATPYSEEVVIGENTTAATKDWFNSAATNWKVITGVPIPAGGKITSKVPVFPYTGMAVLTVYDANNKVTKRYVCPAVNDKDDVGKYRNVNVPQYDNGLNFDVEGYRNYIYEISEDELRDMVGTVTQEGSVVTVNATKSGRSTLEGKVTVNGEILKGLTDAECTAYTSVQWSPLPVAQAVSNSEPFAALLGQSIEVIAQLVDVNGNKVSKAGQAIEFSYNGTAIATSDVRLTGTETAVTRVDTTTDSQGQAKLILKASTLQEILNITARDKNAQYNVNLVIANKQTAKADLYWIDADLKFQYDCTVGWKSVQTTTNNPTIDVKTVTEPTSWGGTVTHEIQPTTGETWEYGVQIVGTQIKTGSLANKTIGVNGLDITMAKAAGGVGTVTAVAAGKVNASSTKAGEMKIVSRIDANTVTDKVTMTEATYAGIGKTSIRKTLNLIADWKANGVTLQHILPTGTASVVSGGAITKDVYVKVVDNNGNPWVNKKVTLKTDALANAGFSVTSGGAITATVEVLTDPNGIAKATLHVNNITATSRTTVTASVDGSDAIADQTFTWYVNSTPVLAVDTTSYDDITGKYLTTFDAATGTITLTFNNEIDAYSVCKGEFAIDYVDTLNSTTKALIITDVTVINNVIQIKVSNAPTGSQVSGNDKLVVNLKAYADPETETETKKSVIYRLTTVNGQQFATDMAITINVDESKGAPIAEEAPVTE